MRAKSTVDHSLFLIIVGLLAWAIPGAGHFMIKERTRGIVIFLTITITFCIGLFVGSIGVVDPAGGKPWYIAQMMASPIVGVIANASAAGDYTVYGRSCDVGQIYTSIAGLLNLLCIISAVYMAYCGRGEMIGEEEADA